MAPLGVIALMLGGCHGHNGTTTLAIPAHAAVYAAALRDVRGDTAASWLVIDSAFPARDLDAELQEKVLAELPITRRVLDAFLRTQRKSIAQFDAAILPDSRVQFVSASQLDTLRITARAAGDAARNGNVPGRDGFWMQWSRAFPRAGGYIMLSPASLSADGASALIHVRVACGPTCGTTEMRLLQRDAAGMWRTTARVSLSES
jgi:hypothetical protein